MRMVFLTTPRRFAMVLIPSPSAKCRRLISAQSSTESTSPLPERPPRSTQARPKITVRYKFRSKGVKFQPVLGGQFCTGADTPRHPVRPPNANAPAQRWIRTIPQECLDHILPRASDREAILAAQARDRVFVTRLSISFFATGALGT